MTIGSIRPFFAKAQASAADEQVRQESLAVAEGLKRHKAGLLDELIVRYQHRLLRYLLFLTGNRETAEDLFQEVWMRVLVRGGQFNGQWYPVHGGADRGGVSHVVGAQAAVRGGLG